jgi:Rod binding domain-containing protein
MRIEAAAAPVSGTEQPAAAKLRKHATEFEGMLLTELMKKMQQTFAQTEASDDDKDPASETISGIGTQALAQALASRNVLGIGAMVAKSLAGTSTEVTSSAVNAGRVTADIPIQRERK